MHGNATVQRAKAHVAADLGEPGLVPATARGVMALLAAYGVVLEGVRAVVVATADAAYRTADFATLFPDARLFVDGRNACAGATLPQGARRLGFGRPGGVAAGRRP